VLLLLVVLLLLLLLRLLVRFVADLGRRQPRVFVVTVVSDDLLDRWTLLLGHSSYG